MKLDRYFVLHKEDRTAPERAFTLIELLVVIAIIGILATVVIGSLNSARTKGKNAQRLSELKTLQTSIAMAIVDGLSLPTVYTALSSTDAVNTFLINGGYISNRIFERYIVGSSESFLFCNATYTVGACVGDLDPNTWAVRFIQEGVGYKCINSQGTEGLVNGNQCEQK